jgi:hypothetical protein
MKNTILETIGGIALAVLMLVTFAHIWVSAQDKSNEESSTQAKEDSSDQSRNAGALEGVWNVQITRLNCQTGSVIGTAPAILTFTRGGTMSDAGTQVVPSLRGPGHGIWNYVSRGQFTGAFQFFRFNADGTLAGRQIVRQQIELSDDGSSITNTSTAQVLDVNGNVIANNCSTGTGTRFE